MQKDDHANEPLQTLKKKEKSAQLSTSLLIGMVIVQAVVGVFLTITGGFSVFTIMPLIFVPIAMVSYNNLKRIKAEIASRNNDQAL